MKYRFMNEHRHDYAITLMCWVLRVARAAFYAWLHELVSNHIRGGQNGRADQHPQAPTDASSFAGSCVRSIAFP